MSDSFFYMTHLQKLCYFTFILQSNLLVWVSVAIHTQRLCGLLGTIRMSNSSFTQLLISEVSG